MNRNTVCLLIFLVIGSGRFLSACDSPPPQYWLDSTAHSFFYSLKSEYDQRLVTIHDLEKTGKTLPKKSSARLRIDSLQVDLRYLCDTSRLTLALLAHNLSFKEKDPKLREYSERLFKQINEDGSSAVCTGYLGSLKMMKVRDDGKGGAIVSGLSTLFGGKSAYGKARDGYHDISKSLEQDSSSVELRVLRASAAVEAAEYLPELLDSARLDLEWLSSVDSQLVPAARFLATLTWAKYYYWQDHKYPSDTTLEAIDAWACRAYELAAADSCLQLYYESEAMLWLEKAETYCAQRLGGQ
ncbi:MAG: hypothetical protein WC544_05125 [Patescibacteria group bacterium]